MRLRCAAHVRFRTTAQGQGVQTASKECKRCRGLYCQSHSNRWHKRGMGREGGLRCYQAIRRAISGVRQARKQRKRRQGTLHQALRSGKRFRPQHVRQPHFSRVGCQRSQEVHQRTRSPVFPRVCGIYQYLAVEVGCQHRAGLVEGRKALCHSARASPGDND